jgi:hypothetical protein
MGQPIAGCTPTTGAFSGLFTVDTSAGTVADLLFTGGVLPFLPDKPLELLDGCLLETYGCELVAVQVPQILSLDFTTLEPGSLVGFDGGAIVGGYVSDGGSYPAWIDLTGSITPEPSSFSLFLLGLMSFVVLRFVVIRKRSQS